MSMSRIASVATIVVASLIAGCDSTPPKVTEPQPVQVPPPDGPDFRQVHWGMTFSEFRGDENGEFFGISEENDLGERFYFYHSVENYGYNSKTTYRFLHGILVGATVDFDVSVDDPSQYLTLFEDLQKRLSQIYGESDGTEYVWNDTTLKDKPKFHGIALKQGGLALQDRWDAPRTLVVFEAIKRSGFKGPPQFTVNLTSKEEDHVDLMQAYKNSADQ